MRHYYTTKANAVRALRNRYKRPERHVVFREIGAGGDKYQWMVWISPRRKVRT